MKYAIVCCSGKPLAVLNVRGKKNVRVETCTHTPHIRVVMNPVIDGELTWPPDELARWTHKDVIERNVTEIQWADHRSWVIRCGPDCPTDQEAQFRDENLPKIAAKLATGTWAEQVDGMPVVPLGVLSFLTEPRNW